MLKNDKLRTDKQYEREKARLETAIKNDQHRIKILKQKGCEGQSHEPLILLWTTGLKRRLKKNIKDGKNSRPEEKMKEFHEKIDMLREAEKQRWNCEES